ncbi:MAG TPA: RNA polymerase factor sigma-54 [Treponemataceae bacterium]|nr:RNA polymerase factor sigma-54 [Treponemataceae bacterium]
MQEQRQNLVQQQRLSLSPQMLQSIRLMAMPFADLRERILEEVEANPALEIIKDPFLSVSSSFDAKLPTSSYISASSEDDSEDHRNFIEGVLSREATLQETLLEQLSVHKVSSEISTLASLIIQNLNSDGFHLVPPQELPGGENTENLNTALWLVRSFEPVGCATVNFQESLVVQVKLLGLKGPKTWEDDPVLKASVILLEHHLDFFEKGKPAALIKALAKMPDTPLVLDKEDADAVFDLIRSLDPFPGRAIESESRSYIAPDVLVRRDEGDFTVVINEEEIPVLGLSPFFMEIQNTTEKESLEARDFAKESIREAQWFMRTLSRRNLTILKLTRALIVFQRDFFMYGPTRLTPLRMIDVAAEIGMHQATVSRAANGKYLQCEWGLFELKYFFSTQIGAPQSTTTSSKGRFSKQGVKEIIKEIIENSTENLSDQKISDLLGQRGIKIARRTVAKYRGELNINSSFER